MFMPGTFPNPADAVEIRPTASCGSHGLAASAADSIITGVLGR